MKKLARLAAGLITATAVASTGAVVSAAGPASAAAPTGTAYFSAHSVIYGQGITVHGTTSASAGQVLLYAKPFKSTWRVLATDTSPSSFSWTVRPGKYTQYYVRVIETGNTLDARTSPYAVAVGRKLTKPAVHSRSKTITGKVAPAYKKRLVTIQKRSCNSCAWKKAKVVRTNRYSKWTLRIPVKKMQYRAVVAASNGYKKTGSPVTHVIVTYHRPVVG